MGRTVVADLEFVVTDQVDQLSQELQAFVAAVRRPHRAQHQAAAFHRYEPVVREDAVRRIHDLVAVLQDMDGNSLAAQQIDHGIEFDQRLGLYHVTLFAKVFLEEVIGGGFGIEVERYRANHHDLVRNLFRHGMSPRVSTMLPAPDVSLLRQSGGLPAALPLFWYFPSPTPSPDRLAVDERS